MTTLERTRRDRRAARSPSAGRSYAQMERAPSGDVVTHQIVSKRWPTRTDRERLARMQRAPGHRALCKDKRYSLLRGKSEIRRRDMPYVAEYHTSRVGFVCDEVGESAA